MRLTATTTLDELGGFAHHLTSIQSVVAHHIVAHHDGELRLAVVVRTNDAEQRTLDSGTNLESQILGSSRIHGQYSGNDFDTIHLAGLFYQLLGSTLDGLFDAEAEQIRKKLEEYR